jgi:hypothetical protein
VLSVLAATVAVRPGGRNQTDAFVLFLQHGKQLVFLLFLLSLLEPGLFENKQVTFS